MLFGVCLRYSKDRTEAEDIAQDGFIKIFQNIKSFDNKGSFEGWMKKIMINTALDRFRKRNKIYAVEDIGEYVDDYNYEDTISEINAKDLLKLIEELTPRYKIVFCLYAIEGYSHNEISKMLNVTESTSRSNLVRARNILQEKVKTFYNVPELIETKRIYVEK